MVPKAQSSTQTAPGGAGGPEGEGGSASIVRGPQSSQSEPSTQISYAELLPPSSQSASAAHPQSLLQRMILPLGADGESDGGGGDGNGGSGDGDGGGKGGGGSNGDGDTVGGGEGEGDTKGGGEDDDDGAVEPPPLLESGRGPQSEQSVPKVQSAYAEPAPPSSQYPSFGQEHLSLHSAGGDGGGRGGAGGDRGEGGGRGLLLSLGICCWIQSR
jgi:hypothetical protein